MAFRRELLASETAPKFSFVMDESVIHRVVGSHAIMSKQLLHLVSVAELPNVTIQIVPFTAGLSTGTKGPFKIIQFSDSPDEDIVFIESPRGDVISDDPNEARSYLKAFERITESTLGPSDSVGLLRKAAGDMA
jgi:hypothetical protein